MTDNNDLQGLKSVRNMLARRGIDISRADVRVQKGVCSIRGYVSAMPNAHIADIQTEMEQVARLLRSKPDIRSVVLEITTRRV